MTKKTPGEIIYDRAWQSIETAVLGMTNATRKGMLKNGATPDEVVLQCSLTLTVVTVDLARLNLVTFGGREPTAEDLRSFFDAAVDLYICERLTN